MTKLEMVWPHPKIPGYTVFKVIQGFEFYKDARGDQIRFPISKAQMIAKEEGLEDNIKVGIQFHYIPKPKGKKIRR